VLALVAGTDCPRPQVKIISGQIFRWPFDRISDFGGLQGRFDDAGDAVRHLILKIEDLVEGAVETVGPKMSTVEGIAP